VWNKRQNINKSGVLIRVRFTHFTVEVLLTMQSQRPYPAFAILQIKPLAERQFTIRRTRSNFPSIPLLILMLW